MTVIAYKAGVMAADKQSTYDGLGHKTTKIRRFGDGSIGGCAGATTICRALLEWYASGADPKEYPDKESECYMLVVQPGGRILFYDKSSVPAVFEDEFIAIGSGRDFAIAVMDMGGSAEDGVRMATKWNTSCGQGIDTLRLEDIDAA